MTLQQIIEDIEQKIAECEIRNEPHNEASFGTGIGVIVSWGDAQAIVNALKSIPAEFSPTATPTYEWTLDDSELQPTKGDCRAMQSNFTAVHEHLDEIGKMIRTLEDAILSTHKPQS